MVRSLEIPYSPKRIRGQGIQVWQDPFQFLVPDQRPN